MSFVMKKKVCIFLIGVLILLAIIPILFFRKTQPKGEYITKDEVVVLTELLNTVLDNRVPGSAEETESIQTQKETVLLLEEIVSAWEVEEYVTYEHFKQWEESVSQDFDVLEEDRKNFPRNLRVPFLLLKKTGIPILKKCVL